MEQTARQALEQGLAYASCWGPDCSRVHDLFDLADVRRDLETFEHDHVMTSWHDGETLDEALLFAVLHAYPGDEWQDADTLLAVTVGEPAWAAHVAQRLSDPQQLIDEIVPE